MADKGESRRSGGTDNGCSTSSDSIVFETCDIDNKVPIKTLNKLDTETANNGRVPEAPPPPDGGYGWVCVAACLLVNMFSWGVVSSYGVYLAHYLSNNLYSNARPLDYAFLGGLNFGLAMTVAPFVTILTRKYGHKPVMIKGAITQTLALCLASFSTEIWHLYLTQGALLGVGVGFAYVPSVAILSQWFDKKRSIASGIAAAGSGLGGVLYGFVTQPMIEKVGLPWTLRITGLTSGSMLFAAAILMKSRNEHIQPRQHGFPIRLLRRYDVNLLLAWSFIIILGYIVLMFSLSDFARSADGLGLTSVRAANITGFVNLGTALGRPLIGHLSDRFGRIQVAGTVNAICAISVFALWIPSTAAGEWLMICFALLAGATFGVFWVCIGPLCAEIAGLVELPGLLSLSWMIIILPCTFSEVIAVIIRNPGNKHGAFLGPQLFAGFSYIVATFIMLELWRVHRKNKIQEKQETRGQDVEMASISRTAAVMPQR